MSDWCRHYNGIMGTIYDPGWQEGRTCKAGVAYRDVRVDEIEGIPPGRPTEHFPCFETELAQHIPCPMRSYLTAEEKAEQKRQSDEAVAEFLRKLASNICPHCDRPIEEYIEVRPCVYAKPCGHRLYQGKAPKRQVTR